MLPWCHRSNSKSGDTASLTSYINSAGFRMIKQMVTVSPLAPHGNDDKKWRWQLHPRQPWAQCPGGHVFQHSGSTETGQKYSQTLLGVAWFGGHSHSGDTWTWNKEYCILYWQRPAALHDPNPSHHTWAKGFSVFVTSISRIYRDYTQLYSTK